VFDLEQQIQAWRKTLPPSLGARNEAVEELESHLRDEVQRLVVTGKSPEQAWTAAQAQLGTSEQLAGEFAKLGLRPMAWLPAQFILVLLGVAGLFMGAWLGSRFLEGNMEAVLAGHIFAITLGYTAMFAVGLLAVLSLVVRVIWGWDEAHAGSFRSYALGLARLGLVLTTLGVVLGAVWARDHLGAWWGWDAREVGGLAVMLWFGVLLACLSWRPSGRRIGMLLGVIGNIVVSLSWFGPVVFGLSGVLHSYGGNWFWSLMAFVLSQLLILLLGLVPPRRIARERA
jgi:hypothetical protein